MAYRNDKVEEAEAKRMIDDIRGIVPTYKEADLLQLSNAELDDLLQRAPEAKRMIGDIRRIDMTHPEADLWKMSNAELDKLSQRVQLEVMIKDTESRMQKVTDRLPDLKKKLDELFLGLYAIRTSDELGELRKKKLIPLENALDNILGQEAEESELNIKGKGVRRSARLQAKSKRAR